MKKSGSQKRYSQEEFNSVFKEILELVESGENISDALHSIGLNRCLFYRYLSKDQRRELDYVKTANSSNIRYY